MRAVVSRVLVVFFLLPLLTAGCSSGGNGGTGPNGNDGSISISVNPGTLTVQQGGDGQVTVTLTRSGGFSGAVTLNASGAPSGVTVQGANIGASASSAQLTVSVSGSAAAGTSTITITASGTGVGNATATVALTVEEVSSGSFSITLSASSLDIKQGTTGDVQVTIARSGGFSGEVSLSISGLPSGVTAAFAPQAVAGTVSTLTLTVGAGAAVGSYTLTLTGMGTDVSNQAATLTLGVTSGGGGGQEISFAQCTDLGPINWVAYQDGDGPWTPVTPVGTTFTFELQEDRGAIALVQIPGGTANIFVLHLSTEEIKTLSESGCDPVLPPDRTVTGSVAGMAATDFVNLTLGPAFALVSPGAPNFQFVNLPEGSLDLIASLYGSAPIELKKIIIRRDLNPAHNDVLPVLNFNAAEAVEPVVRNLTVNNIQGETTSSFVRYVMSHGANGGLLYSEPEVSANPNRTYHGVPAPAYQAGDLHRITVQATSADLSTTRTLTQFIGEAVDQTVTLPPAIGPTPVTLAATAPYVRLRLQYTPQAEFDQYYTGYFTQTGGGTLALNFSGAYVGGGAIDFTLPDFSAMPGWNGAWGFQPGTVIEGSFNASGWTGGALGSQNPNLGTIIRMSGRILDDINP